MQISTVSVYDTPQGAGMTEHSPLVVLDDPTTEVVSGHTYGAVSYTHLDVYKRQEERLTNSWKWQEELKRLSPGRAVGALACPRG